MNDLSMALMAGIDIPIPECKLILHQPRIKEIAFIGNEEFFVGVQTLCLHKSMFIEDKTVLDTVNNFQIFMTVMGEKEMADKKTSVKKVLQLLFPKYNVLFTPRSLLFQPLESGEAVTVDETNFEELQDYFREVFCSRSEYMDQTAFNPANDAAREIAKKLMRGRQRVAEQKNSGAGSVFTNYLSILTVGLNSMSLQNLLDCTMFQLYDLMERYTLFVNWDIDVKMRLAGGKPDSQPDNWMKNIH